MSTPVTLFSDECGATLSDDGVYRFRLWRGHKPRLGFVMCNPSTADALTDDHTIRRCMALARENSYHGIDVCNLYAYRATQPDDIPSHPADLHIATGGQRNIDAIREMATAVNTIVVAWGATYAAVAKRLDDRNGPAIVAGIARANDVKLRCLGVTKGGHPRHPSRLGSVPLIPWPVVD